MGRPPRIDVGGSVYHVLNRANLKAEIFSKDSDYLLFQSVLLEGREIFDMRILSYTTMPNHWHFSLYPEHDGQMSEFMQWVTLTHTQRYHAINDSVGYGHLYQGRYKSFLIDDDSYARQLMLYIDRNPLRASLVQRAEEWKWGSLWIRENNPRLAKKLLSDWPTEAPKNYLKVVNNLNAFDDLDIRPQK